MSGLELLRLLRERRPDLDVLMMTAHDDLPIVAEAMREGARDFLLKPLDLHHLRRVLGRALEDRAARLRAQRAARRTDIAAHAPAGSRRLVGRDPTMVGIFKVIGQVAATRASVVIRGESGTGKELVARAIHDASPWAAEPFVAVNCTAIPGSLLESELFGHVRGAFTGATTNRRGRFAQAGRGTLFLDEIGDTSTEFQTKLLRVLQEHEYHPVGSEQAEHSHARVIAATHRDLEELVERREFREDLYYRLRVVELRVPPLRERKQDVPLLASHLLEHAARDQGRPTPAIAPDALERLLAHRWPGNVRELQNCLTRAVVLAAGGVVRVEHLELDVADLETSTPLRSLADMEREHVALALKATRGNKTAAAQLLGVSRPRLDRLIRRHRLDDGSASPPVPN
jgi:DNA-binding NtrC family response regulator